MIHKGNCLEVMRTLPEHSIDMVLCDLPYGTTQNKWDSVIPLDDLWSAYMATNPKDLINIKEYHLAVGVGNNEFITEVVKISDKVICAWGNNGTHLNRSEQVCNMLSDYELYTLGKSKTGQPKHPLYIKSDTVLQVYRV